MKASRKREIRVLAAGTARRTLHSVSSDSTLLRFLNVYSPQGFVVESFSELCLVGAIVALAVVVASLVVIDPASDLRLLLVVLTVVSLGLTLYRMNGVRTRTRVAPDSGRAFCLWCGYELTEDVEHGRCPECGGGYSLKINERIVRLTLAAARPDHAVVLRRARRLWARAVWERERSPRP